MAEKNNINSAIPEPDCLSLERVQKVASLSAGAHVYICGICGTGTAAVASLLKQLGFRVSGSDKTFYPPMGDLVRSLADRLYHGYNEKNFQETPDLVVMGNSLSRGNPEVEYVLDQGLPYASMPEIFQALLIGSRGHCRHSVVVTGTHGKTTTSAIIAGMLDQVGWRPGYFIGGMPADLSSNIRPVEESVPEEKKVVVLEGDEYDSAFFAKWPKFHSYRPDVAVVTSVEFDHADIYRSVEEIETEFARFVARVPAEGLVLVCGESDTLSRLIREWKKSVQVKAEILSYGQGGEDDFVLKSREVLPPDEVHRQKLCFNLQGLIVDIETKISGSHNALNLLAAAAVGKWLGLTKEEIGRGLERFSGVKRRQQVITQSAEIIVFEDFAHHPTEVRVTLTGLCESYPAHRIIAVFEPRSNTSRRNFFQKEYVSSFGAADLIVLADVADAGNYSNTAAEIVSLNVPQLVSELRAKGKEAYGFSEIPLILEFLLANLEQGDLVVVMSNGDFGGLLGMLVEGLKG